MDYYYCIVGAIVMWLVLYLVWFVNVSVLAACAAEVPRSLVGY